MAATYAKFSLWNPIKFVKDPDGIDYKTVFPNGSNELDCELYYKGTLPVNYHQKVLFGTSIDNIIQIQTDATSTSDITLSAYDSNGNSVSLNPSVLDITPSSWTGDNIYKLSWNMTEFFWSGGLAYYTIELSNGIVYKSNILDHQLNAVDCVEIDYSNSENDFGMLFYDDPTTYRFKIYIDGNFTQNILASVDKSTYDDDRGDPVILRSTPKRSWTFKCQYLPGQLVEKLSNIFALDDVIINGVKVAVTEGIEVNQLSDMYNGYSVTATLVQQDWDYLENS